ncbi:MAG: PadR family transcriptional regulator [Betaproteobacteria bacterium]|nr:PadR family transcriptional regulator [Betaproteobacteria bacterium]
MPSKPLTPLQYAILGLIHMQPSTGYAIRKIFAESPMGNYSASQGAIYPALAKLVDAGLINPASTGLKRAHETRIYQITTTGQQMLMDWLRQPLSIEDMVRNPDLFMLRFAFLSVLEDTVETIQQLKSFAQAMKQGLEEIAAYLAADNDLSQHASLALQHGATVYRARAQWARAAITSFETTLGEPRK